MNVLTIRESRSAIPGRALLGSGLLPLGSGLPLLGAGLLLLGACAGGDQAAEAGVTVQDSAGITVIQHPGDPMSAGAGTPLDVVLSFGLRPSEYAFERLIDGALLPNGDVVVVDIGASEVVRIAADGSSHSVLAGSGEGPGEVRMPISVLTLPGDSILVEDDGNSKLLVLHDGEVARVSSVANTGQAPYALRAYAAGSDGRLLMGTSSYMPDQGSGWIQGHMVVAGPDGLEADTVGAYDMAISTSRDGPENPFRPFGQLSASPSGFVGGRSDRAEVVWYGTDGAVERIARWTPVRDVADQSDVDQLLEMYRTTLPGMNPGMPEERVEQMVRQRADRIQLTGDPVPLYIELIDFGPSGVWLSEFRSDAYGSGGASAYRVVSPDGQSIRRVDLPQMTRVFDVSGDRVLGVARDELDVQYVVVYRLDG